MSDQLGPIAMHLLTGEAAPSVASTLGRPVEEVQRVRRQILMADRLMLAGRMISKLAHELAGPLNIIMGRADLISSGEIEGTEAVENGAGIVKQSEVLAEMLRALAERARPMVGAASEIEWILKQTMPLFVTFGNKRGYKVTTASYEAAERVALPPDELQQALSHLLWNALEAGGPSPISLEISGGRPPGAPLVRFCVRGPGTGPPSYISHRIFEPFVTSKTGGHDGANPGLGLTMVRLVAVGCGGRVELDPPGQGSASVSLFVPAIT